MARKAPLQIFVRSAVSEAVDAFARDHRLDRKGAIAKLISDGVADYLAKDSQPAAEHKLMSVVDELVMDAAAENRWESDITAKIFEAIAADHLALYEAATVDGNKTRINRAIGARVKAGLGAQTMMRNGYPVSVQVRDKGALIRLYTALERPPTAPPP